LRNSSTTSGLLKMLLSCFITAGIEDMLCKEKKSVVCSNSQPRYFSFVISYGRTQRLWKGKDTAQISRGR
jgi:hypothetical protein